MNGLKGNNAYSPSHRLGDMLPSLHALKGQKHEPSVYVAYFLPLAYMR